MINITKSIKEAVSITSIICGFFVAIGVLVIGIVMIAQIILGVLMPIFGMIVARVIMAILAIFLCVLLYKIMDNQIL